MGTVTLCLASVALSASGGPALGQEQTAKAIALGRTCRAPIVEVTTRSGDFDVYVESPFARVALVSATALMMHQNIEAPGVRRAMQPGYRIWLQRKREAPMSVAVTRIAVRSPAGTLHPVAERNARFFLGTTPSHGIVEPLRARFPEFLFEALPAGHHEILGRRTRDCSATPSRRPIARS